MNAAEGQDALGVLLLVDALAQLAQVAPHITPQPHQRGGRARAEQPGQRGKQAGLAIGAGGWGSPRGRPQGGPARYGSGRLAPVSLTPCFAGGRCPAPAS